MVHAFSRIFHDWRKNVSLVHVGIIDCLVGACLSRGGEIIVWPVVKDKLEAKAIWKIVLERCQVVRAFVIYKKEK